MYKEERDVVETEMTEIYECDMEEFDTLDSSDKTIAILGDRWWPQAAKQEGYKIGSKFPCCNVWKQRNERPLLLEMSPLRVGTVLRLGRGSVVNGRMTKTSNK